MGSVGFRMAVGHLDMTQLSLPEEACPRSWSQIPMVEILKVWSPPFPLRQTLARADARSLPPRETSVVGLRLIGVNQLGNSLSPTSLEEPRNHSPVSTKAGPC